MLTFGKHQADFLARRAIDMLSVSLAAVVENALGHDPYAGDIYVFVGRAKNRVKIIAWDRSGFWLCSKRLRRARNLRRSSRSRRSYGVGHHHALPSRDHLLLEGINVHHATYHALPSSRFSAVPAVADASEILYGQTH